VRKFPFSSVFSNPFKGCILIFEYSYFLLQKNGDASNTLDLAVKEYQTSGTQAIVLNALQHAIKEHSNDHYNALMRVTIDIIVNNCMCKWFFSALHKVSNDVCQQRSSFHPNHTWRFSLTRIFFLAEDFATCYNTCLCCDMLSTCYSVPIFYECHLYGPLTSTI